MRRIRETLDAILETFPYADRLPEDPVSLLRRYDHPDDAEVAGFIASTLALGSVASIRTKTALVLEILGPSPASFVRAFHPRRDGRRFAGWTHRWYRDRDLVSLLDLLREALGRHGSLQAVFLRDYDEEAEDVGEALAHLVEEVGRGTSPLLANPRDGSACKRMNLYLRWMVRPDDGVDLGVWKGVSPGKLIIPLDVHVARISRHLGITRRRTVDWKMAVEVTRFLRGLDPEDPVKYDFPLCHLGVMRAKKNFRAIRPEVHDSRVGESSEHLS
jgi:uncharacterized protein (TIGR02757 family)